MPTADCGPSGKTRAQKWKRTDYGRFRKIPSGIEGRATTQSSGIRGFFLPRRLFASRQALPQLLIEGGSEFEQGPVIGTPGSERQLIDDGSV